MDSETSEQPPLRLDSQTCPICCKAIEKEQDVVHRAMSCELQSILNASQVTEKYLYAKFSSRKDKEDLSQPKLKVKYHSSCWAKFKEQDTEIFTGEVATKSDSSTSEFATFKPLLTTDAVNKQNQSFNVKKHCVFCEKSTKVVQIKGCSTKEPVLACSSEGTSRAIIAKVAAVATKRRDELMQVRIGMHTNLSPPQVKYHQSCYSNYVSNFDSHPGESKKVQLSQCEQGFELLTDFIKNTILSLEKSVTSLSELLQQYRIFLSRVGVKRIGNYKAESLKKKLKDYFQGKLMFIERKGHPILVCSCEISVVDAVEKFRETRCIDYNMSDDKNIIKEDKIRILHQAAAILRKEMKPVKDCNDDFQSQELCLKKCAEYIPNHLYDFLMWCTDAKSYKDISSCMDDRIMKSNLKVISLCHNLIAQCKKIRTPIPVGLGVTMYREYVSKNLLEYLSTLGYSISYSEVQNKFASYHSEGDGLNSSYDLRNLINNIEEIEEIRKLNNDVEIKEEIFEALDVEKNDQIVESSPITETGEEGMATEAEIDSKESKVHATIETDNKSKYRYMLYEDLDFISDDFDGRGEEKDENLDAHKLQKDNEIKIINTGSLLNQDTIKSENNSCVLDEKSSLMMKDKRFEVEGHESELVIIEVAVDKTTDAQDDDAKTKLKTTVVETKTYGRSQINEKIKISAQYEKNPWDNLNPWRVLSAEESTKANVKRCITGEVLALKEEKQEGNCSQETLSLIAKDESVVDSKREMKRLVGKGKQIFNCILCTKSFKSKKILMKHQTVHTGEKSRCEVCYKVFSKNTSLKKHMNTHTKEITFPCGICDKLFFRKDALKLHMSMHKGEKKFKCDLCGKQFLQHTHLKIHGLVHSKERKYICEICGKTFIHKSSLHDHSLLHYSHYPFKCEECGKMFKNRLSLKNHSFNHTGKRFTCEKCGKLFSYMFELKKHVLAHSMPNMRSFQCVVCNKSYTQKSSLNVHMNIHSRTKVYPCNICHKEYAYASSLKKHKQFHTGTLKRYECEVCGKLISQSSHIKSHMRVHTGEKPFQCEVCSKQYIDKRDLNKHILKKHVQTELQ